MIRDGWNMNTMLRVKNNTIYDIGINTMNGQGVNIPANGTTMLEIRDILMTEANYPKASFFGSKKLLIIDERNEYVSLSDVGGYDNFSDVEKSIPETEIEEKLGWSARKLEAWLDTITDEGNLEAIFQKAQKMDLPRTKMEVLEKKMPKKIWHVPEA